MYIRMRSPFYLSAKSTVMLQKKAVRYLYLQYREKILNIIRNTEMNKRICLFNSLKKGILYEYLMDISKLIEQRRSNNDIIKVIR